MTEDQQKIVTDNHNLIYSFLHLYGLPVDEHYDLAAIGLCEAVIDWDPEGSYCLSTIAYRKMRNLYFQHLRRNTAKRRTAVVLSLNKELQKDDGEGVITGFDCVHSAYDIANEVADCMSLKQNLERLSAEQKQLCRLRLQGINQTEIGQQTGCSQPCVSRRLKSIQQILLSD